MAQGSAGARKAPWAYGCVIDPCRIGRCGTPRGATCDASDDTRAEHHRGDAAHLLPRSSRSSHPRRRRSVRGMCLAAGIRPPAPGRLPLRPRQADLRQLPDPLLREAPARGHAYGNALCGATHALATSGACAGAPRRRPAPGTAPTERTAPRAERPGPGPGPTGLTQTPAESGHRCASSDGRAGDGEAAARGAAGLRPSVRGRSIPIWPKELACGTGAGGRQVVRENQRRPLGAALHTGTIG